MSINEINNATINDEINCYLCRPETVELEGLHLDFNNPETFNETKKILNAENISLLYIPVPAYTVAIVNSDCIEDDSAYNMGVFGNPVFGNIIFAKTKVNYEDNTAKIMGFENEAECEALKDVITSIKNAEREKIIDENNQETSSIYEKFSTMPKKEFVELYIDKVEHMDEKIDDDYGDEDPANEN